MYLSKVSVSNVDDSVVWGIAKKGAEATIWKLAGKQIFQNV